MDGPARPLREASTREAKWVSAVKLVACFAVIQVNAALFALLRERILGLHQFPSPLALAFAAQLASLFLATVVCRIRKLSYQLRAAASGAESGIRRVPLIQFALMCLSDSVGRSFQTESRPHVAGPVVAVLQAGKVSE